MQRKLRASEDKAEILTNVLRGKDEEMARFLSQKVALTQIFETDLMQMTDKLIHSA